MSATTGSLLRPLAPTSWLRLTRRTARLRLTLLYSGLFLLSGTCVLVGVYVLVARGSPIRFQSSSSKAAFPVPAAPLAPPAAQAKLSQGVLVGPLDARAQIKQNVAAQRHADLGKLLEVSWLVLAISAVASAVLGWFAAGRVLRPLRSITSTARTISARNLHERLALAGPEDEFKQLGDTLDDLLSRLEASFEAQRRFVANASHELRTPLTVERTLLQVALADRHASAAVLRSTCEELVTIGEEHERLLEALLTLASSDRGLDHREPVDLAALAEHVLAARQDELSGRSLELTISLEPAATTGDPALIERLVANLVDNAASHNIPNGRVEIRTRTDGRAAVLSVTNTGPPVPPEEIARLFEPFQRLPGARAGESNGHFGLGLSIVRAIANAHGAAVGARPAPGGGLAVEVRFP